MREWQKRRGSGQHTWILLLFEMPAGRCGEHIMGREWRPVMSVNRSFVILRPERGNYLAGRRCNRLVWPHCQPWFHLHHLVYNNSSAPLKRRTGLTRCSLGQTHKPPWLTEWHVSPWSPFTLTKGGTFDVPREGEETTFLKRKLASRDTMTTGGLNFSRRSQWVAEDD